MHSAIQVVECLVQHKARLGKTKVRIAISYWDIVGLLHSRCIDVHLTVIMNDVNLLSQIDFVQIVQEFMQNTDLALILYCLMSNMKACKTCALFNSRRSQTHFTCNEK